MTLLCVCFRSPSWVVWLNVLLCILHRSSHVVKVLYLCSGRVKVCTAAHYLPLAWSQTLVWKMNVAVKYSGSRTWMWKQQVTWCSRRINRCCTGNTLLTGFSRSSQSLVLCLWSVTTQTEAANRSFSSFHWRHFENKRNTLLSGNLWFFALIFIPKFVSYFHSSNLQNSY